jgi:hypothetical protein
MILFHATQLGIDGSTMRKCLKAGSGDTALGRYKPVSAKTQESELAEYCKDFNGRFYVLTLQALRKLGYEFGEENYVKHPFDKSSKVAEETGHINFWKHVISL